MRVRCHVASKLFDITLLLKFNITDGRFISAVLFEMSTERRCDISRGRLWSRTISHRNHNYFHNVI